MTRAAKVALLSLVCACSLACSHAGAIQDPEALGYGPGPGRDLANGYIGTEGPPFERPAPAAWPLDQQPLASWIGEPPVLPASPSSLAEPSDHPREREVCQHIVMTTLREQEGSDANLDANAIEDYQPVIRECVEDLIDNERPARGPEDYAAMLDCVLEQSTSAAMQACE